jgi:D-tyrosyl-tRNA(Tyr) deacylase
VRAVIQRVSEASVSVGGVEVGRCGRGLAILVGVAVGDSETEARRLAGQIARLRVFANEAGRFDRSLLDIGGEALVVSQFTLLADTSRGNRPSFSHAAAPTVAERVIEDLVTALRDDRVRVATGKFGAAMTVTFVNDGPVTIVLDVSASA